MTSKTQTILIIGATGDLGREFTRRFHAQGKTIIATGRNQSRLESIRTSFPGVETLEWEMNDLHNIRSKSAEIIAKYPNIDTVFIAAGYGDFWSFFQPESTTDDVVISTANLGFTSRALLARHFLPHLEKVASTGKQANLMIMGSGLGFFPSGFFPIYSATQSAVHSLTIAIRQQINGLHDPTTKANLNVIQVVAPYVDTAFDAHCRETAIKLAGGHFPKPMPLDEYMEVAIAGLAKEDENGRPLKEVTAGFATTRVDLWRDSIGKAMEGMGMPT